MWGLRDLKEVVGFGGLYGDLGGFEGVLKKVGGCRVFEGLNIFLRIKGLGDLGRVGGFEEFVGLKGLAVWGKMEEGGLIG